MTENTKGPGPILRGAVIGAYTAELMGPDDDGAFYISLAGPEHAFFRVTPDAARALAKVLGTFE